MTIFTDANKQVSSTCGLDSRGRRLEFNKEQTFLELIQEASTVYGIIAGKWLLKQADCWTWGLSLRPIKFPA